MRLSANTLRQLIVSWNMGRAPEDKFGGIYGPMGNTLTTYLANIGNKTGLCSVIIRPCTNKAPSIVLCISVHEGSEAWPRGVEAEEREFPVHGRMQDEMRRVRNRIRGMVPLEQTLLLEAFGQHADELQDYGDYTGDPESVNNFLAHYSKAGPGLTQAKEAFKEAIAYEEAQQAISFFRLTSSISQRGLR